MKKFAFLILFALGVNAAHAQTPPADPAQDLATDWQAYATAEKHVFEDLQKVVQVNQALKAENDKLKADAAKAKPEAKP